MISQAKNSTSPPCSPTAKKPTPLTRILLAADATEQFLNGCDAPAEKITAAIADLAKTAAELVIIHSEVGADGIDYTPETAAYIREMATLGRDLASMADLVVECVYGVPIVHKGVLPCS